MDMALALVSRLILHNELIKLSRIGIIDRVSFNNDAKKQHIANMFESGDSDHDLDKYKNCSVQSFCSKPHQLKNTTAKTFSEAPHLKRLNETHKSYKSACVSFIHQLKTLAAVGSIKEWKFFLKNSGNNGIDVTHKYFNKILSSLPFLEIKPTASRNELFLYKAATRGMCSDFSGDKTFTFPYVEAKPKNKNNKHSYNDGESKCNEFASNLDVFEEITQLVIDIEHLVNKYDKQLCKTLYEPCCEKACSNVAIQAISLTKDDMDSKSHNPYDNEQQKQSFYDTYYDLHTNEKAYVNPVRPDTVDKDNYMNSRLYCQSQQQIETFHEPHYRMWAQTYIPHSTITVDEYPMNSTANNQWNNQPYEMLYEPYYRNMAYPATTENYQASKQHFQKLYEPYYSIWTQSNVAAPVTSEKVYLMNSTLNNQFDQRQCESFYGPYNRTWSSPNITPSSTDEKVYLMNCTLSQFDKQQCKNLHESHNRTCSCSTMVPPVPEEKVYLMNCTLNNQFEKRQLEKFQQPYYRPCPCSAQFNKLVCKSLDSHHKACLCMYNDVNSKPEFILNCASNKDDSDNLTHIYSTHKVSTSTEKPKVKIPKTIKHDRSETETSKPSTDQHTKFTIFDTEIDKVECHHYNKSNPKDWLSLWHNVPMYIDIPTRKTSVYAMKPEFQRNLKDVYLDIFFGDPTYDDIENVIKISVEPTPKHNYDEKSVKLSHLRQLVVEQNRIECYNKYKESLADAKKPVFLPPLGPAPPTMPRPLGPMPPLPGCPRPVRPKEKDAPSRKSC